MAFGVSMISTLMGISPESGAALSIIAGLSAALLKETWDSGRMNRRLPKAFKKGTPTGFSEWDITAGLSGTVTTTLILYASLA